MAKHVIEVTTKDGAKFVGDFGSFTSYLTLARNFVNIDDALDCASALIKDGAVKVTIHVMLSDHECKHTIIRDIANGGTYCVKCGFRHE